MFGLVLATLAIQKPVVLPPRAMRLDALLKELSSATGTTYRASGPMIGRIVLSVGPARPAAAVCADLAAATWGKWRQVGDEWLLDEDRTAVLSRERARLAGRIEQVKQQLDKLKVETAKPFDEAAAKSLLVTLNAFDEAEKKDPTKSYPWRRKVESAVPANSAVRRVVAAMDPTDLASLEVGTRVYSDYPTRLQSPLPSASRSAIRQLERDQATWTRVYPDNTDFMEAHRTRGWMSMDPRGHVGTIVPGSLRLFLKVQAFEHGQTLFSGYFVDKAGKTFQFGEFSLEFRNGLGRTDPAPKVDPKEPKLSLSPEAIAFSESRTGKQASPILRPIFLNPEKREPLDVLNGEGLRGAAKVRNASLVAWLGDDATNFTVGKGESAGEFLKDFWDMKYEVREKPGSILIRPLFGAQNVERARLGALTRIADARGYVPLDEYAEYAAASDPSVSQSGDPMTSIALSIVTPGVMEAARADWKLLRLWGSFSRVQRQSLMQGGTIPWTAVPKAVSDRLVDAVLNAQSYEIRQNGPSSRDSILDREPTEILAKGLDFGPGVSGSGGTGQGVFAASPDENPYNGGIASPWALAQAAFSRETRPDEQHYDGLPKTLPNEFRLGSVVNFGLQINLSPTLIWSKSGQYGEFDMRQRPQPLEAMPDSFRKEYERAMESLRKRRANG